MSSALPGSIIRFTDFVNQAPVAPVLTPADAIAVRVNSQDRTDQTPAGQINLIIAARLFTAGATCVITATDLFVGIRKASGSATAVTLPTATLGRQLIIADCKGDADVNPISFSGTIDGGTFISLNFPWQSVSLVGLGAGIGWKTVS